MKPRTFLLLSFSSFIVFFIFGFLIIQKSFFLGLDEASYKMASSLSDNLVWLRVNSSLTFLGQGFFLVSLGILLIVFLFKRGFYLGACWYFSAFIFELMANSSFKYFFDRPRPPVLDPTRSMASLAFPSGHASGALFFYFFSLWILLQLWSQKTKPMLLYFLTAILVFLIGFSRVGLGVHWATDILGGYFFGLSWLFLMLAPALKFNFYKKS